jgi:hypothetical protein
MRPDENNEHRESFEVQSDDGSIVRQFPFDTRISLRAAANSPVNPMQRDSGMARADPSEGRTLRD